MADDTDKVVACTECGARWSASQMPLHRRFAHDEEWGHTSQHRAATSSRNLELMKFGTVVVLVALLAAVPALFNAWAVVLVVVLVVFLVGGLIGAVFNVAAWGWKRPR